MPDAKQPRTKLITLEQLDPNRRKDWEPTGNRQAFHDDRPSIVVHPQVLRWGGLAAVVYDHPIRPDGEGAEGERLPAEVSGFLVGVARVHRSRKMDPNVVHLDQALRNALGIPFEVTGAAVEHAVVKRGQVYVYPLQVGVLFSLSEWFSRHFIGRRIQMFRVTKLHVSDIEKRFVRVPSDQFEILGFRTPSRAVFERPLIDRRDRDGRIRNFKLHQGRITVFPADTAYRETMIKLSKTYPDRFFPAARRLYERALFNLPDDVKDPETSDPAVEPDLPPVYTDLDFRMSGVGDGNNAPMTPLTAIAMRRESFDALGAGIRDYGAPLLAAIFVLLFNVVGTASWASWLIFATFLGVGAFFVVWRLRSEVG